ncbi:host-nuclease inhibitor Gam family protein [Azospirillum sp. B506]|uniref:host-nuclease inhibitor Gam family protein n=1 Tax=Azospirillum sp. B506 TaxID=137721 RepID=UPI000344F880|nr:host-nuclease inhibitor Gam family protein [Azospirillum sp. B506]
MTVAQANLAYEAAAAPLRTAIAADTELLRGYFDANRASLLTGTKKSVALPTGTMGMKKTVAKLVVADADALLKLLEEDRKLRRFIRTKSEVDRAALLAEPKVAVTIDGVSVEGGDDAFFVKPLMVGTT